MTLAALSRVFPQEDAKDIRVRSSRHAIEKRNPDLGAVRSLALTMVPRKSIDLMGGGASRLASWGRLTRIQAVRRPLGEDVQPYAHQLHHVAFISTRHAAEL